MENTNKAMMIAFGMLVAIMIIGIVSYTFVKMGELPKEDDSIETAEQLRLFNQEYEVYDKKIMYGTDVISALNKAQSNNDKYVKGNFLSGSYYNTDYIMDVVVIIHRELHETIELTYLELKAINQDKKPNQIIEQTYVNTQGPIPTIPLGNVFKKPSAGYQHLVYGNSQYWNSLKLQSLDIKTNIVGEYHLLDGSPAKPVNGVGTYTDSNLEGDSELKQLISYSTEMTQEKKNINGIKHGLEKGWNKARWRPAVYDLKTRKFECKEVIYNSRTGRICYLEFEEHV